MALKQRKVGNESIILGVNGFLVQSHTNPANWYVIVRQGKIFSCQCKGYQYRGTCAHLRAVEQLERERAKRDTAILAGPGIDAPMFAESRKWERPAGKSFEELFGQSA